MEKKHRFWTIKNLLSCWQSIKLTRKRCGWRDSNPQSCEGRRFKVGSVYQFRHTRVLSGTSRSWTDHALDGKPDVANLLAPQVVKWPRINSPGLLVSTSDVNSFIFKSKSNSSRDGLPKTAVQCCFVAILKLIQDSPDSAVRSAGVSRNLFDGCASAIAF